MKSKLFSLIGGLTTGIMVTMALVLSSPSNPVQQQLADHGLQKLPVRAPDKPQVTAIPQTPEETTRETVSEAPRTPANPGQLVTATPVTPLVITSALPDQTTRNTFAQPAAPAAQPRSPHQLSQTWHPTPPHTPRYMPHYQRDHSQQETSSAGNEPRPPRPPDGSAPAGAGSSR